MTTPANSIYKMSGHHVEDTFNFKTSQPLVRCSFLVVLSLCILFSFLHLKPGTVTTSWLSSSLSSSSSSPAVDDVSDDEVDYCNWYDGEWVWDESYPLYQSKDCGIMETTFRCTENGRSNNSYTKWRWQPKHCNLPRFDPKVMLEKIRNRRVVFVGDSTGRNQWESLLCLLSSAVSNKSSVYEVHGHPVSKSEGFLVVRFDDYNCTVEYYVAPFLVNDKTNPPPGTPNYVKKTIKLDQMLPLSKQWKDAYLLIFNTGHWWTDFSTKDKGKYFQEGDEVKLNMTLENAYQLAINTAARWIYTRVNMTRTRVFFRTFGPKHFSGGDWNSGGGCRWDNLPNLTLPFIPSAYPYYQIVADVHSYHYYKLANKFDMLNVTYLTSQRKDGHPSLFYHNLIPYIKSGQRLPANQDCLHWCLPGVPDTWNQLLYAEFLNKGGA